MSASKNASHVDNDYGTDPENASATAAFRTCVLEQVAAIPAGRVLTYGEVALLAGRPGTGRQVGGVLFGLSEREAETFPWHRVINAQGAVSTDKLGFGDIQRGLLVAEGVTFDKAGRCDLKRLQWWPDEGEDGRQAGLF